MSAIKSVFAFVLGAAFILLCYYFVNIPLVAAIGLYIAGGVFNDGKSHAIRKVLLVVLGIAAALLYGYNTFYLFSTGSRLLTIAFEAITTIAIIGAMNYNLIGNSKHIKEHSDY